jgi:hypothetical protein
LRYFFCGILQLSAALVGCFYIPRNYGTRRARSAFVAVPRVVPPHKWVNPVKKSTIENRVEVGVFSTVEGARRAVQGLLAAGFTKDQITVMCSDQTKERYFQEFEHQEPAGTYTPTAAIAGATIGALLGGASVIVASAATGGVALLAAGPITAWAGGVAGGLVGAMMTRGVEKELANYYQQAVMDGQILVAAEKRSNDSRTVGTQRPSLTEAAQILADAGAKPLDLPEG